MSTDRITVAQYDQMIDSGALGKHDTVELIDGRLSPKPPRSRRHVQAGRLGFAVLQQIASSGWRVAKGDPIVATEWSKPDPDLMLIRGGILDYDARDATTRDAALIVKTPIRAVPSTAT